MTNTECLLKVSDNAEPYFTEFNILTGKVADDFEWLLPIDIVNLFDYSPEQRIDNIINRDLVYDVMFRYRNCRMLINGPGAEFVLATDMRLCRYVVGSTFTQPYYNAELVTKRFTETGCVLSPCLTFNIMHPAFKLAFYTTGNKKYIMTRFGLRDITGTHNDIVCADDSVKITPAMLLDAGRDIYAGYSVDGEVKYIYLEEVNICLKRKTGKVLMAQKSRTLSKH